MKELLFKTVFDKMKAHGQEFEQSAYLNSRMDGLWINRKINTNGTILIMVSENFQANPMRNTQVVYDLKNNTSIVIVDDIPEVVEKIKKVF